MVIYKTDVPDSDNVYTIDGDWISVESSYGIIKFRIPKKKDEAPLFLRLFGVEGEPTRDEIDRLLEAVAYMRHRPFGMPEKDYEEHIASILGMKYGKYMEKRRKGEIRYVLKEKTGRNKNEYYRA